MNFTIPDEIVDFAQRTRTFVEEVAIPMEPEGFDELGVRPESRAALIAEAKQRGLPCPQASPELGGLGVDMRGRAVIYEEAGRSLLGAQGLNCAAPDEGNMHLLERVGTDEQKDRFLAPLVAGDIRSCFAMTEPPPGAGSDPAMLRSTATKIDGGWRLDGHKWFITGAVGAEFAIFMARTGEQIDKHGGATMFLVELGAPGVEIVRAIATYDAAAVGGHAEMRFDGVEVADDAVLGAVDQGYRYAQVRLAPARLTHCMRWLGLAQRAHEMTIERVAGREAFGQVLGTHGMAQQMLADNEIELRASRLLTWQACDVLDRGGDARQESSIAKTFVAEAVHKVVDRCVQLHGAVGVSGETILSRFLSEVRPFRIYDGPSEVHRWAIARRLVHTAGSARPITDGIGAPA